MQDVNKRWQNGKKYLNNKHFYNAILKYGWDNIEHQILYTNLSKEAAEQLEIELISKYKTTDNRYGYNIDKGGSGSNRISKHQRELLRMINIGANNPHAKAVYQCDVNGNVINKFNTITEATKALNIPNKGCISECCKGRKNMYKGFKWKYAN